MISKPYAIALWILQLSTLDALCAADSVHLLPELDDGGFGWIPADRRRLQR